MFKIHLEGNKIFLCDENTTIFDAARTNNITLEHSCLKARCSSCIVKILSGKTKNVHDEFILTNAQKKDNYVLSCNVKPLSDLYLDVQDLGNIKLFEKKIIPAKINSIEEIGSDIIRLSLRLPPNSNFQFIPGQYVNIIKDKIKRSYSIANSPKQNQIEFYIKKFKNGTMSEYWFKKSNVNDLLRVEGPLGSFFLRETSHKNIIFLATGTGITPIKSIIENILQNPSRFNKKKFWIFFGSRYEKNIFWKPELKNEEIQINFIPVLSQQKENWDGEKGYVQDAVLRKRINLTDAQVYACGSINMIESAKKLLTNNFLKENCFFSDAFVESN